MSIFQNTIGSKSFICELGVLIYEIYNLATISFVGFWAENPFDQYLFAN